MDAQRLLLHVRARTDSLLDMEILGASELFDASLRCGAGLHSLLLILLDHLHAKVGSLSRDRN